MTTLKKILGTAIVVSLGKCNPQKSSVPAYNGPFGLRERERENRVD